MSTAIRVDNLLPAYFLEQSPVNFHAMEGILPDLVVDEGAAPDWTRLLRM